MRLIPFALLLLLAPGLADAKAKKIDDYHWTGVERVVAIGDLHGDYDQYIFVMQSAGLINKGGKWIGGVDYCFGVRPSIRRCGMLAKSPDDIVTRTSPGRASFSASSSSSSAFLPMVAGTPRLRRSVLS